MMIPNYQDTFLPGLLGTIEQSKMATFRVSGNSQQVIGLQELIHT